MSAPQGSGPYLLLIDYGSEGQSVQRYETKNEMIEAVLAGRYQGPFLFAKELVLSFDEDEV